MNTRNTCKCGKKIYRKRIDAWDMAIFYYQKTGVYQSVYKCDLKKNRYHLTRQDNTPPKYFFNQMTKWFGL